MPIPPDPFLSDGSSQELRTAPTLEIRCSRHCLEPQTVLIRKSLICDSSNLFKEIAILLDDRVFYLDEILPRREDEPDDEDMRWNYLKLFIKWIKTHKIRTKIADKRIGYEILWEFGRELKAPTYQNAVMTHLCEDDDFFQRILAKDILRLYKRVSKDGVDIHEHMFLRFCLDVVIFPGNRSLFRKIVVLGGPLAVLVAEEAIDYAHCLAADPSDLPLGGRLDPTHNNQLHHYLLDKNLNIGDAFLQDPENLGVSMSGGNGDTGVQPEDGNDVQRIDAKEEEESLLDDERSIEMSEAGLEALYNGVKKRD